MDNRSWFRSIFGKWDVVCLFAGMLLVILAITMLRGALDGELQGPVFLVGLLSCITGFISILLGFLRFISRRLFHRVRSKIVATYFLTGVLPLVLVTVLFILLLQAFLVQLASYLMKDAIERENLRLASIYLECSLSGDYRILELEYSGFRFISVQDDSIWAFTHEPFTGPLPDDFPRSFLLAFGDTVFTVAAVGMETPVVIAAPIEGKLEERLERELGGGFIFSYGFQGQQERHEQGSIRINLGSNSEVTAVNAHISQETERSIEEWLGTQPGGADYLTAYIIDRGYQLQADGAVQDVMVFGMLRSRLSFIAGKVMQGALPQDVPMQRIFFWLAVGLAAVFVIIELVALLISLTHSRSITKTISQLHRKADCVAAGDFSYRIDSKRTDQLGLLASSFDQMSDSIETLLEKEKEKERLEKDLAIAREVQHIFFPRAFPEANGITMLGKCLPARMVSGDYFDCIPHPEGYVDFFIGDICGKGIAAALLMAASQTFLRSEAVRRPLLQPTEILSGLNDYLVQYSSDGKFSTVFYGRLDMERRVLTFCNGGHPTPMLFRRGGVLRLKTGGMIPGIRTGTPYEQDDIALEPGDLLAVFTDGFTEVFNSSEEEYGEERFAGCLPGTPGEPLENIVNRLVESAEDWSCMTEQADDMTIFLIRVQ